MAKNNQIAVKIELLGQQFTMRGDEDRVHLKRVADYVKRKLVEVSTGTRSVGPTKVALLTALNVADDYFKAIDETNQLKSEVEARSHTLLKILDQL